MYFNVMFWEKNQKNNYPYQNTFTCRCCCCCLGGQFWVTSHVLIHSSIPYLCLLKLADVSCKFESLFDGNTLCPHWNNKVAPYHKRAYTYRLPREYQWDVFPLNSIEIRHKYVLLKSSSRRKFRSQTSDNKDKWSRGGQSQRRERVRREESECQKRRSKSEKRKSEKCGAIWQDETWTIARRCGAKRIGKSKCQKDVSIFQLRATFGSWDVEKVHSAVAWSTLQNQLWKNSSAYSFGSLLPVEL